MTRASPFPSSVTNSRRRAAEVAVARGARDRRPAFRAVHPAMVDASEPRPTVHQRGEHPLYLHEGGEVSQGKLTG